MLDLAKKIRDHHQQINIALQHYLLMFFKKDMSLLLKAMRYGVLIAVKRLRPFLVYQTGNLFGILSSHINALAAAIECIHAYSLIHDDLYLSAMDN